MRTRTKVFCSDLRVLILIEDIERSLKLWPVMPSIEPVSINLTRRRYLGLISGFSLFWIAPALWAKTEERSQGKDTDRAADFSARLNDLMGTSPKIEAHGLTLELPQVAENGALVPVTLSASGHVNRLYLLAEGNPGPLLAEFQFYGAALPKVSLRVKLNQSGPVTALSRSDQGWMRLEQQVKVAKGGCG